MPFPIIPILVNLAVGLVISVIAYVLTPKPKPVKPEVQDLKEPTASAGRPMPVVFGTIRVTGVNVLWYGEKTTETRMEDG